MGLKLFGAAFKGTHGDTQVYRQSYIHVSGCMNHYAYKLHNYACK